MVNTEFLKVIHSYRKELFFESGPDADPLLGIEKINYNFRPLTEKRLLDIAKQNPKFSLKIGGVGSIDPTIYYILVFSAITGISKLLVYILAIWKNAEKERQIIIKYHDFQVEIHGKLPDIDELKKLKNMITTKSDLDNVKIELTEPTKIKKKANI